MMQRLFYFMHIHKTAGSSFRSFLDRHFAEHERFTVHRSSIFLREKESVDWNTVRLVWGHFGYAAVQHLPRKPFLMTFLRDPVERVLSHYDHIANDPVVNSFEMLHRLSLPEMLERFPLFFSNLQTRNLALDSMSEWFYMEHDPAFWVQKPGQLNKAKQRLREEFDFIGIKEDYAGSIERLCRTTGWRPEIDFENVNRHRKHISAYPATVINLIIELNQDDIALYEYAKGLVEGR